MAYGDAEDISSGAEQPVDFHHERENEAAALLAALVAFSRDAILSCSPQGIIQSWNDGAQRLFGWSSADAVGRSVMFLVTEAGAGAINMMRAIKHALDPQNIMNPGKIFKY